MGSSAVVKWPTTALSLAAWGFLKNLTTGRCFLKFTQFSILYSVSFGHLYLGGANFSIWKIVLQKY